MTNKFTAAEARKMCGPTPEDYVDGVWDLIRQAASEKKRQVNLHQPFWVNGGYDKSPDWKAAVKLLEAEGYTVEFYYKELQFVDMYTIVRW